MSLFPDTRITRSLCRATTVIISICQMKDNVNLASKLAVKQLKIAGKEAKTVGRGVIRAGDTGITINTPAVSDKSSIAITFLDDLAGRTWYVSERTAGAHFTIKLSANLSSDISFQWVLIDTDEDGSEVQYSSQCYDLPYPSS